MTAFYITTPIYYVNDVPHLGTTYTTIVADTLARYHRSRGQATYFLTGTDEHGEKIEEAAQAHGTTPQAWADGVVGRFHEMWKTVLVTNDDFIRTTEPRHEKVVIEMWRRMEAAGDIYLGAYEGLYCVGCEAFYTEKDLDPGNVCKVHPNAGPVSTVKEPSYFFRMSKYGQKLLDHIASHPEFIQPEYRRNEVISFVRGGLEDLSISRTSFKWGIPVPGDPDHVIYVWIDALTNYVSALGGPGAPKYETFWRDCVHLIGKDILRFHAVYWPCMLMSAGLPLPKTVFAHGWWTVDGKKISKSDPSTRVDPAMVAGDIGPDALRYFMLREMVLGQDGDFSRQALFQRFNSDLANDLGNLVNRTLSMVDKYVGGVIPPAHVEHDAAGPHAEIAALANRSRAEAERLLDGFAPSRALEAIWEFIRGANRYVDAAAAWTLAKDPARKAELEHVLHTFLECALWAARLVYPAMPAKAAEIVAQLGLDPEVAARWPGEWNRDLPAGGTIRKGAPLWPRLDDKRQAELLAKWTPATAATPTPTPTSAPTKTIDYADFQKLDLRVVTVVAAERVPKADKLLKLTVDLGNGGPPRQVVAGIAESYDPAQLVGRQVIFLANLAPRPIRGIESQGMILAAGEERVVALSALDRSVPNGTKVR
jgi:methionyl-tRNA synthetase